MLNNGLGLVVVRGVNLASICIPTQERGNEGPGNVAVNSSGDRYAFPRGSVGTRVDASCIRHQENYLRSDLTTLFMAFLGKADRMVNLSGHLNLATFLSAK